MILSFKNSLLYKKGMSSFQLIFAHLGKFNRGDYRTGKRLNMRKVIPYIASQFRKDKIWLRRTKPSKRHYQICLAIDDSSSMVDNHTKQVRKRSVVVVWWEINTKPCPTGQVNVLNMIWQKVLWNTNLSVLRMWYHIWEDLKFKEFKRAISGFLSYFGLLLLPVF